MLTQEFIEERKQDLLKRKAELEEELKGLSPHTELEGSLEDSAMEYEMDNVSQDLIARIKGDIQKIEAALERIAQGAYGIDADGNEIGEDRLVAIPWAETAISSNAQ